MRLIRLTAAIAAFYVCSSASADQLDCTLNLKRGISTQAFQLRQKLTAEGKPISYPSYGQLSKVTEGELPFEIYLGWEKIAAKITFRQATLENADGKVIRASRWKCFEAVIETTDGRDEFSCGDKDKTDNPFADPNQRWQPAEVRDNAARWPTGLVFQESFESGNSLMTLECRSVAR